MSRKSDFEEITSGSEWSDGDSHHSGVVSLAEGTPEGRSTSRQMSTDSTLSSSSSSSTSSGSTLVEAPVDKQRAVARNEVETQTEGPKRRRRNRTRRQRREAKLRREALSQSGKGSQTKGSSQRRDSSPGRCQPPSTSQRKTSPSRQRSPAKHRHSPISRRQRSPSSYRRHSPRFQQSSMTQSLVSRSRQQSSSSHHQHSSSNRQRSSSSRQQSSQLASSSHSKKTMKVSVSATGRSVEAREPSDSRDSRSSSCPVPGCKIRTRKLKRHAFECHLPAVFRDVTFPRAEIDPNYQQIRGDALTTLARWILGSETSTVFDLVFHVNENKLVPESAEILERQIIQLQLLSYEMRWRQPTEFSLHPVNSPAAVIHWRVLLSLISLLTRQQRQEWRMVGQGYTAPSISDESDDEPQPKQRVSQQIPETIPKTQQSLPADLPTAYDSHFHLDRLSYKVKRNYSLTVDEVLRMPLNPLPQHPVNLLGGLMIYCDPQTYPEVVPSSSNFYSAIGFHPKHAVDFTQYTRRMIAGYLQDKGIVALGEIGLDRTEPKGTWGYQEAVLKELLTMASPDKPVILHVRGQDGVDGSGDTYSRCLSILRECLPQRDQPIHVHCFGGFADQVRQWRADFPNTYFGYTGMTRNFSQGQLEGLREVPDHRLLVETDSPYLSANVEVSPNTPMYVGDTAALIASARGVSVDHVLDVTARNFRKLYTY